MKVFFEMLIVKVFLFAFLTSNTMSAAIPCRIVHELILDETNKLQSAIIHLDMTGLSMSNQVGSEFEMIFSFTNLPIFVSGF